VRVVIPPVLAAEADKAFSRENRQVSGLTGRIFDPVFRPRALKRYSSRKAPDPDTNTPAPAATQRDAPARKSGGASPLLCLLCAAPGSQFT
jgi:hypothetical protein